MSYRVTPVHMRWCLPNNVAYLAAAAPAYFDVNVAYLASPVNIAAADLASDASYMDTDGYIDDTDGNIDDTDRNIEDTDWNIVNTDVHTGVKVAHLVAIVDGP